MQRARRTNPYPFTWEIPVAILVAVSLLMVLGLQAGRSVANTVAGNGWVFVDRAGLFSSLGGLFAGHADAGLTGVPNPAGTGLMWTCIALTESLLVIGCLVALKLGLDRWGPGRLQGMATRAGAEALLGQARLRKHAKVIRPDLYGASSKGEGR